MPEIKIHRPVDQAEHATTIGDSWLTSNRPDLGKRDASEGVINMLNLAKGTTFLEIGCSNGWRLKRLRDHNGLDVSGVEPSALAVSEAVAEGLNVVQGTADKLPYPDNSFDVIMFGYCWYLIPPTQILKVAAETDRVLKEGGILIIYDYANVTDLSYFCVRGNSQYKAWAFHWDYAALWDGHPVYKRLCSEVHVNVYPHEKVCVFSKQIGQSFLYVEKIGSNTDYLTEARLDPI